MAFEPGKHVNDYEVVSILGTGGMGCVYCVRNSISGRTEAMKVLLPDLSAEPDLAHRFTSEIRTLAGFDHPNIAQLRTAFQYENQLVMIMEYVEGVSLEQRAKQGPIPQEDVVNYMSQALSALAYAHSHGVVHRDIKPANMMVTSHGIVKLMDFGIAKSSNDPQLTRPGMTMGSMYYMSPEQVRGTNVDARSDIYSLGITMYELLAGRRPFEAQTTFSILNQQLNEIPKPPLQLNPSLPQGLNDIILMALAKDPDMRFRTADAFKNALRPYLHEQPTEPASAAVGAAAPLPAFVPVPVSAPVAGVRPKSNSRRGLWIGLGAVAAVLAMIAAATMIPRFVGTHAAPTTQMSSAANPTLVAPPSDNGPSLTPAGPDLPAAPPAVAAQPAVTPPPATTGMSSQPAVVPQPTVPKQSGGTPRPSHRDDSSGNGNAQVNTPQQPAQPDVSQQTMDDASERLTQLEARASAVSQSIDSLRQRQQQQGLDIRTDILAAQSRMNAHKDAANRAIQEHNVAAANKFMEEAEGDLQALERFMGR